MKLVKWACLSKRFLPGINLHNPPIFPICLLLCVVQWCAPQGSGGGAPGVFCMKIAPRNPSESIINSKI